MQRSATGADGREWTLRSRFEWREPATADRFEHDVAGGGVPAAVLIVILVIFVVVLLVWMPSAVVVPFWVLLLLLLVGVYFPLRWVWMKPWSIVAETEGNSLHQRPPERWVGTVRGFFKMREEVVRVRRSIQRYSEPEPDGHLRLVE